MMVRASLFWLGCLTALAAAASSRVGLFDGATNHSVPTLHTSISTLLPILPKLAPAPSHTVLTTLATPGYKHLLYNWLCWLRYKAKWSSQSDVPIPVLVMTSDEALAHELSEQGIVTWYMKGLDLDALAEQDDEGHGESDDDVFEDPFLSLRVMDVLSSIGTNSTLDMVKWGSIRYQSLMLERTVAISLLVGALADTQKIDLDIRLAKEQEWEAIREAHDWTSGKRPQPEPYVGVKGILLADHDAVWMQSPHAHLQHFYRHGGPHPSLVWAPDMQTYQRNQWQDYSMPCACFLYTRTDDELAHTSTGLSVDPNDYRPAQLAAKAWQLVSMCHVVLMLESIEQARDASQRVGRDFHALEQLARGRAPSFQATALGPALYMARHGIVPNITFAQWRDALASGDASTLHGMIREAGLDEDTCLTLAQDIASTCPAPESSLVNPPGRQGVRTEPLPYDFFPPGMAYFRKPDDEGKLEDRPDDFVKPCVIHANYALGTYKEDLLKREGLWAVNNLTRTSPALSLLGSGAPGTKWTCDLNVMANA